MPVRKWEVEVARHCWAMRQKRVRPPNQNLVSCGRASAAANNLAYVCTKSQAWHASMAQMSACLCPQSVKVWAKNALHEMCVCHVMSNKHEIKRVNAWLCVFQALNGFLLILTCEGEVFFATHTIESYLGFHQVRCAGQGANNYLPSRHLACITPDTFIFYSRSFSPSPPPPLTHCQYLRLAVCTQSPAAGCMHACVCIRLRDRPA